MTLYFDLPKFTELDFSADNFEALLKTQVADIESKNRRLFEQHTRNLQQAVGLIESIYGSNSAPAKYLRRVGVDKPPNFTRRLRLIAQKYNTWLGAERRREYGRQYRQRSKDVNEFLQRLGYIPGEHYRETAAITFAKTVVNPADPAVRMLPEPEGKRE